MGEQLREKYGSEFSNFFALNRTLEFQIRAMASQDRPQLILMSAFIARILQETEVVTATVVEDTCSSADSILPADISVDVRRVIDSRRKRREYFSPELFGEPAWDMMLDLAWASFSGREISVSSLCIASGVPTSTALRWLETMLMCKVIERRSDPSDGRRIIISLTGSSQLAMTKLFEPPEPNRRHWTQRQLTPNL